MLELAALHLLEELLALDFDVAIFAGGATRCSQRRVVGAFLLRGRFFLDFREVLPDQLCELLVVHDNLLLSEWKWMRICIGVRGRLFNRRTSHTGVAACFCAVRHRASRAARNRFGATSR